jgi:hypothetical protein
MLISFKRNKLTDNNKVIFFVFSFQCCIFWSILSFRGYTKFSENIIKFFPPKFCCTYYVAVYLYVLIHFTSVVFNALQSIDNAINIFDYITWNVRMISDMEIGPKKSIVASLIEAFKWRNRGK